MNLVDELKGRWSETGLVDELGNIAPTFIEEVGSASAENVRSAALKRWFNKNPERGAEWLKKILSRDLFGIGPYSMIREYKLDEKSRVDLVVLDKNKLKVVFIEAKWMSSVNHDAQLANYRNNIDLDYAAVPLVILSSIEHARPVSGKKFNLASAKWSDLADYLNNADNKEDSLEFDLWRTVLRLKILEDLLKKAIDENRSIGDFFELNNWLNEKNTFSSKSEDLSGLFRHIFFTLLSEKLCANLKKLDFSASWRRSETSSGGKSSDIQSDVSPEKYNDGIIITKYDLDVKLALFLRFHAGNEFDSIDVSIGSSFKPYKDGAKKAEWKKANASNWELLKTEMRKVRNEVTQKASEHGLRGMRNCKIDGENWFQKLVDKNFERRDVKINELLNYAAGLRFYIIAVIEKFSCSSE